MLASPALTVKTLLAPPVGVAAAKSAVDTQTQWLANQITRELGEKIAIRAAANGDYVMQITFDDLTKLETTLQSLQELVGQIREAAGPRARSNL